MGYMYIFLCDLFYLSYKLFWNERVVGIIVVYNASVVK